MNLSTRVGVAAAALVGLVATVAPLTPAQAHEGVKPHAHMEVGTCSENGNRVALRLKLVNPTGHRARFRVRWRLFPEDLVVNVIGVRAGGSLQDHLLITRDHPRARVAVWHGKERIALRVVTIHRCD